MTHSEDNWLRQLYRRAKGGLNNFLDRVIDFCSMILSDAYRVPWPMAQSLLRHGARFVGDLSWLIRDMPRLPAFRLTGEEWTIVFVGREQGLLELRRLFFAEQEVFVEELGRVTLWKLPERAEYWVASGVNLIVCELSRLYPWRFRLPFRFTIPTWVQQVVPIPDPPRQLLVGRRQSGARFRINRAQRNGFSYRFTQSKADFDFFYYRMYVPFVTGRHGELAMITPYEKQRRQGFDRGGLLLITQNGKPVAGGLCYLAGDTCYGIEGGVLDNDPFLFQQGVNVLLTWYTILWGYEQGAKWLNMGGSRAWCSNGAFEYKQRWKPRVVRLNQIYSTWTFLAKELLPSLEDRLNQIGFIGEAHGQFYRVFVRSDLRGMDTSTLNEELAEVQEQGLAGIAVISPYCSATFYPAGCTNP